MSDAFKKLWLWPTVLGLLTLSGLFSALVSDGLGDWWAWLGLGLPVLAMGWYALPWRKFK